MESGFEVEPDTPTVRALKDITFGSIAGIVSEFFEYPFDLAKVRLQSQVLGESNRFKGPWDCLLQTWRDEGVKGLYRGLPVPLVGAMAETAALFLAYSELQNMIRYSTNQTSTATLTIPQLGIAAAGAGFLTSFILTPIELVKCKLQVQMLAPLPAFTSSPLPTSASTFTFPVLAQVPRHDAAIHARRPLPGPLQITSSILRASGPRGLWLGHTGTVLRETGGTASWFVIKESIAVFLLSRRGHPPGDRSLAPWESALSGALSGGACVAALYPADTVKSAIQTSEELHGSRKANLTFWNTARTMWRTKGWAGLYAGCGMTMMRALPSSGVVFLVYDGLSQRFG